LTAEHVLSILAGQRQHRKRLPEATRGDAHLVHGIHIAAKRAVELALDGAQAL
jgi:hypothetical protein